MCGSVNLIRARQVVIFKLVKVPLEHSKTIFFKNPLSHPKSNKYFFSSFKPQSPLSPAHSQSHPRHPCRTHPHPSRHSKTDQTFRKFRGIFQHSAPPAHRSLRNLSNRPCPAC